MNNKPIPKLSSKSAKAVKDLFTNKEQEKELLEAIEKYKNDVKGFKKFLETYPFDTVSAWKLYDKEPK